jgi:hypothetical protein
VPERKAKTKLQPAPALDIRLTDPFEDIIQQPAFSHLLDIFCEKTTNTANLRRQFLKIIRQSTHFIAKKNL